MRQILLIFSLFCASYMTVNAQTQTNTWTGKGANTNWNTIANWSANALPSGNDNVVIPTGFTVNLNVAAATRSIAVQGNSTLNISGNLSFIAASSFAANVTVNWLNSSLLGGGTLTNNGTVNLTTGGSRYISGGTTIINNGLFTMPGGGYLYLYDTSVFNNAVKGVFDIQSDPVITYSGAAAHNFNNQGLLKKSSGDATAYIDCFLSNTGSITVQSGTLSMRSRAKTFEGGIYNVTAGKTLLLSSPINVSGTLTGALNGSLYWATDVSVASAATFNFSGTTGVQWANGSLIGGGVLTNTSKIILFTGGSRYISGNSRLNNTGIITMPAGGYLYLYDTSVLNNQAAGIFDIQSDPVITYSGAATHNFNNQGLLKKSSGDGTSYMDCFLSNTGTITVESGILSMRSKTKTFNGGIYNVTAGKSLAFSSQIDLSGTLTGALNGPLYWTGNVSVAKTATFNFSGNTGVQWVNSSLVGGGVLTNISKLSLISSGSRYISGGTTLNNTGSVIMPDGGYLYLYDSSVFNNALSGVFDIQSDPVITYSGALAHKFINLGLIKKSSGNTVTYIDSYLSNSGTITVESGTLNMRSKTKTFDGGTYNVSSGKTLSLSSQIDVSKTLTGTLDGSLYWAGNVFVATTATFNFSGATGVQWANSSLLGGGVLTNASKISLATGGSRYISGGTTLNNTGTVIMPDGGYLYLYDTSILNNAASGVFDIQSDPVLTYSGSLAHNFNNLGLLKKSSGSGTSYIDCNLSNSGTISADSGNLSLRSRSKINTKEGIIKGTATLGLPSQAIFTNDGTFAPGGSPGILTVLGDYKSSPTSVLDVELFGTAQGQQHDVLAITGNGIFEGSINVNMNFAAKVNDKFVVATTTGTISKCTLAKNASGVYDGKLYAFDVKCNNSKEVVLTLANVTLGIDDFELSASNIVLFPNPARNRVTLKNNGNIPLISATLIDISGRILSIVDLKGMNGSKEISLEACAIGNYFIKIDALNSSIVKQVVKQ